MRSSQRQRTPRYQKPSSSTSRRRHSAAGPASFVAWCAAWVDAVRTKSGGGELDLGYNSITAKTAHILAEALALNTSLRSLVVDGNILNRSGAMVCLFPSFCARVPVAAHIAERDGGSD